MEVSLESQPNQRRICIVKKILLRFVFPRSYRRCLKFFCDRLTDFRCFCSHYPYLFLPKLLKNMSKLLLIATITIAIVVFTFATVIVAINNNFNMFFSNFGENKYG